MVPLPHRRLAEPGPTLLNPVELFPEESEWEAAPEHHHEFRTSPVSESVIKVLERVKVGADLEGGEKLCVICQEEMDGGTLIKLKCKHLFHESCCTSWLRTSNFCPLCCHQVKFCSELSCTVYALLCSSCGEFVLVAIRVEDQEELTLLEKLGRRKEAADRNWESGMTSCHRL
ncbi:E3 ubiquitin-protein ligase RING1-like [Linum perenne]